MRSLARTYRIATSLSIAVARLRETVATAPVGAELRDVALLTPTARTGDERASITWQVESISTRCGAWRVSVERDRATWQHAGVIVTVFGDTGRMTATGWQKSDAQYARAMRIVELRAAQLERELADLLRARVFAEVIAVAPAEILLIVNALGAAGVEAFRAIEGSMRALWPDAVRDEAAGAALRDYPTDPNDARLIDAGLSPEDRELIARVNAGWSVAKHVRARWGESDENERLRLNKRLHELRKRHSDLVRPARRKL